MENGLSRFHSPFSIFLDGVSRALRMGRVVEREIVHSLDEVPAFASEEEEREWWATHDLAPHLWQDATEEHQQRVARAKQRAAVSGRSR